MKKLSPNILKKLGHYVYIYSDPDTKEIFYVGKGKGNRLYAHLKDVKDSSKVRRIKEIKKRHNSDPIIEILIHGIIRPEEAAYLEYQRKLELYKSAKARSNELESTLRLHFDSQRELEFDARLIREQKRLLDMQPKIIGRFNGITLYSRIVISYLRS